MKKMWSEVKIEELDVKMTLGGTGGGASEIALASQYSEYISNDGVKYILAMEAPDELWDAWSTSS